jgi:hypothetical protein
MQLWVEGSTSQKQSNEKQGDEEGGVVQLLSSLLEGLIGNQIIYSDLSVSKVL